MTKEPLNHLMSKRWRMNNLYKIVNKEGKVVQFRLNAVQEKLFQTMHNLNIILKARQEGMTTFTCIYFLDECLFNDNKEAGIIAHTKKDASDIFRRKIQFPYDHLPEEIRALRKLTTDSKVEMGFSNGSVISVGTSLRSATLQYLLVSELGKVAKNYPEKAREIMTGALETVTARGDTLVFVESTAEGNSGIFYDLCDNAEKLKQARTALTRMDFKFHFFPWFDCPDYSLPEHVVFTKKMAEYFADVEVQVAKERPDFKLTKDQMAWYIKKHEILGEDMMREYPSTSAEAWVAGITGTYFKTQFQWLRENGHICKVPVQHDVAVDTWWDLGMDDSTSIWFTQDIGREIHVINYYENNGEGLEFYRDILDEYARKYNYHYGRHVPPHDINVRELGTGISRLETARKLGIPMEPGPAIESKMDSIQKARSILKICFFDEENCADGIEHLENYRKQWDEIHGVYKDQPLHNEHSHGADAYQTFATGHDFRRIVDSRPRAKARPVRILSARGWAG
jgi:hypothetical protein